MDPDKEHFHTSLISPRKTSYVAAYGWICNFCQRRTLGKCYRHRCKEFAWNNCLSCNRILKENVLIYKDTEKTYCDKLNLEKTIKKPTKKRKDKWRVLMPGVAPGHGVCCIECNMEIGSDFCWISHKANVCSRRVQCTECKRLVYYNGSVPMKPPNGGKYMPGERKKNFWNYNTVFVMKTIAFVVSQVMGRITLAKCVSTKCPHKDQKYVLCPILSLQVIFKQNVMFVTLMMKHDQFIMD